MFLANTCVHFTGEKSYHANMMSFWRHYVDLRTFYGVFKSDTHGRSTQSQLVLSRKWRRQTKTRRTDRLFKFVFHQDWRLSTRFANWNQQNVTRMFQEHLHIIGMVDLATVARILHHVAGHSIRIAEKWNLHRASDHSCFAYMFYWDMYAHN